MSKRTLKTVEQVIEAFGGTSATAEWAGVGPSAVSNWISKGFIPPGWHFRMSDHFAGSGLTVSRDVFSKREEERPRRREMQPAA